MSAVVLIVVFAVVAFVYFSAPERRAARPVSRITAGVPRSIVIDPGHPDVDYVGTSTALLMSRDDAATWQPVVSFSHIDAAAVPSQPPFEVVAVSDGVWRWDGSTFALVGPNPPTTIRALAIDPRDARRLVTATVRNTLTLSTDGGKSWEAIGDNAPQGITGLAFGTGANPTLFASTAADGVFASGDGRSWSNASGFVNGALPTRVVTAIAFDPLSGDRYTGPSGQEITGALYAGTNLGLLKSIDAGVSWSQLPFHEAIVALAVAPDGSHRLLAADESGAIYLSLDGGATWGN